MRTLRLVSLSERALGFQLAELEIERGEVELTLEASFEEADPGLRAERLEEDTQRMAHQVFRQARSDSRQIGAADRRP